jgi:hypothetical protein
MEDETYKALDKLSNNSQPWNFSSYQDKSICTPKKGGIYEIKDTDLKIKIDALTKNVNALAMGSPSMLPTHSMLIVVPSVLVLCT